MNKIANQLGVSFENCQDSEDEERAILEQLEKVPYIPYPVALHTVDIITSRIIDSKHEILLGRKPNNDKWVLIGGFVEPGQTSESAALRELHEETNILVHNFNGVKREDRLQYLGSFFVDDVRYKNSVHKITTSLFHVEVNWLDWVDAKAGDDIEEIKWVDVCEVLNELKEFHKPLFLKYLTTIY